MNKNDCKKDVMLENKMRAVLSDVAATCFFLVSGYNFILGQSFIASVIMAVGAGLLILGAYFMNKTVK